MLFLILKNLGYVIQFINILILTLALGDEGYGAYAFILIIFQYSSYLNFGVPYGVNYYLSYGKKIMGNIISTGLKLNLIFAAGGTGILILFLLNIPQTLNVYRITELQLLIALVVFFQILNQLFVNIYRTFGNILKINFYEISIPLLILISVIVFRSNLTVSIVLWVYLFGNLISSIVFVKGLQIKESYNKKLAKLIVKKGLNLLIFNVCFYLIFLINKTIIAFTNAPILTGKYHLGSAIANIIFLVTGSLEFLIFPQIVDKLKKASNLYIMELMKFRQHFIIITSLLVLCLIYFTELYFWIFKENIEAILVSRIVGVSYLIYSMTFGHTPVLLTSNKDFYIIRHALIATIISGALSLINFTTLPIREIITYSLPVTIGVSYYTFSIVRKGLAMSKKYNDKYDNLLDKKIILFIFLVLTLSILKDSIYLMIFTLPSFVLLFTKEIKQLSNFLISKISK